MTSLALGAPIRSTLATPDTPRLYPALWLLIFVPVSALVVVDLLAGVFRPEVWAARLVPGLLALAPLAWASASSSAGALRARKELRLLAPTAVSVLVLSSLQLASDLAAPRVVQLGLSSFSSMTTLCVMFLTLVPWAEEERHGTLALLATSPLAPKIALEKGALAAYFVVVSYLMQQGRWAANTESFAMIAIAGHLLALAVGPTWFFFLRTPAVAIGAAAMAPAILLVVTDQLVSEPSAAKAFGVVLAVYGIVMLGLTRRSLARGMAWPAPVAVTRELDLSAGRALIHPLRIDYRSMLPAIVAGATTPLLFGMMWLVLERPMEEGLFIVPTFMGFLVCCLAPALTLAASRQLLSQELVSRPRAAVFRSKLISSAIVSFVCGVLVPLPLVLATTQYRANFTAWWVLSAVTLWAVSFALGALLHDARPGVGGIVAAAAAVVIALVLLQLLAVEVGAGGRDGVVTSTGFLSSVAVITPLAVWFAWRRLVTRAARPGRDAALMISGSALYAVALGAAMSVLSGLGWLP